MDQKPQENHTKASAHSISAMPFAKPECKRSYTRQTGCYTNKSLACMLAPRPSRRKRAHSRGSSLQRINKRKKPNESRRNVSKSIKSKVQTSKLKLRHNQKNKTCKKVEQILCPPEGKPPAEEVAAKPDDQKRLDALAKFGRNFYCASVKQRSGLRPIYIDASNVAFSHGQNERFSVQGLKICIDYFRKRGHEVKAFVPYFRLRKGKTTDQKLLHQLVTKKLVITTPTLHIQNQQRSPCDHWYIIQSAAANGGIIVSSDNFDDIVKWNPNLRPIVEEHRLVPTFVDDMIIFPVDPHANRKNNLEQMLKF